MPRKKKHPHDMTTDEAIRHMEREVARRDELLFIMDIGDGVVTARNKREAEVLERMLADGLVERYGYAITKKGRATLRARRRRK